MKQPIKIGVTFTKPLEGWEEFYKKFKIDKLEYQDPLDPTSILNHLYWEKAEKTISKPFKADENQIYHCYTLLFKSPTPGVPVECIMFKNQLQSVAITEILEGESANQYNFWIWRIENLVEQLNTWYEKIKREKYRSVAFELYEPKKHLFYFTLCPGSQATLIPCQIVNNVKGMVKLYQVTRYQIGEDGAVYKKGKEDCIGERVDIFNKIEEMKLRAKEHSFLRAEYYSKNIVLEGGVVLPKDIFNIILKCV